MFHSVLAKDITSSKGCLVRATAREFVGSVDDPASQVSILSNVSLLVLNIPCNTTSGSLH